MPFSFSEWQAGRVTPRTAANTLANEMGGDAQPSPGKLIQLDAAQGINWVAHADECGLLAQEWRAGACSSAATA